jgi:hypothetical protein
MPVELVHPHPQYGEPGTVVTDPDVEGQLIAGGYAVEHKGRASAAATGRHGGHAKSSGGDAA